jgi:hypothetical protein
VALLEGEQQPAGEHVGQGDGELAAHGEQQLGADRPGALVEHLQQLCVVPGSATTSAARRP